MPVRYIDDDHATTEGRPGADRSDAPRRRRPPWVVLGLAVALVAVCVTWFLTAGTGRQPAAGPQPSGGNSSTVPDPQDTPTPPVDPTEPEPQATPLVPARGEVPGVPGLWQGTANITGGNANSVWGVRVGWPQTVDGAVAAAFNGEGATYSLAGLLPEFRGDVQKRIYVRGSKSAPSEGWAAKVRELAHINARGDVVRDGKVSPLERPYIESLIRYGAYRVMEVKEGVADSPTWVVIEVWFPVVVGVGTDSNFTDVAVFWRHAAMDVVWERSDWKLKAVARKPATIPTNARRTNQPYNNVRALLGPGWMVPADGTEDAYPGAILTGE